MAESAAPSSDENKKYVVRLKERSLVKTASKSAYKRQRNACSSYAPLERTVLRTLSVTKNKHHIFAPRPNSRRA